MGGEAGDIRFDLDDFRAQIRQLRRFRPLRDLMKRVPGLGHAAGDLHVDLEAEIGRIEGILDSMTPAERKDPRLIDAPRRRRIAAGAGVYPTEVASLIKQYEAMAAVVRQMGAIIPPDQARDPAGLDPAPTSTPPRRAPAARRRRDGRPTGGRDRGPSDVRRLQVDLPLSPQERETLRRLWEILARNGRPAAGQEPWFSNWNRNLRLWDFVADD